MYYVCTSKNRKPWFRTNRPLSSPAICDPDQDAAKHIRTKEEASSQHRMWGVGKHWPRHKLALNTETQLHDCLCSQRRQVGEIKPQHKHDIVVVNRGLGQLHCITQQSGFSRNTCVNVINFQLHVYHLIRHAASRVSHKKEDNTGCTMFLLESQQQMMETGICEAYLRRALLA